MAYSGKHIEHQNMLTALQERADVQGYLTPEDILEFYPQEYTTTERLEKIVSFLRRQGVEILEEENEESLIQADHPESTETELPTSLENVSSDDTVEIYLKEMSRVPLLSVEEEIDLAKRIEKGREAQIRLTKIIGKSHLIELKNLEETVEDGLRAREHIIKANTRLVVSIAKRYIGRGVPFLDLIQEGNLGLMKAVEKYEYLRGFRFSTYATWWIRQTITRSIADQGRTIRLPVHMTDRIRLLYRISHELEQNLGRPPTIEEISIEMEMPKQKIQWMLQVSWIPLSLESPVGDEDDSELGFFVEDEITPTPSQVAYENMLRERLDEVLATLSPREARILRLRFGLDDNRPYTLEEVGAKFGLTRERIRQIEGKALRRLRHPCRARQLREYL